MKQLYLLLLLLTVSQYMLAQSLKLFNKQKDILPNEIHNLSKGTILTFSETLQTQLIQKKAEHINIDIPYQQEMFHLNLHKVNLFSNQFNIVKASDFSETKHSKGYFLQGTIEGVKEKTSVAVSIFENEIAAIINDGKRTLTLTKLYNNANKYVFYNEADLIRKNDLLNGDDMAILPTSNTTITKDEITNARTGIGCTLDIYFEISYQTYVNRGSNMNNAVNYLCAMFNNIQLIFKNEQIDIQIREIKVWNVADPEDALTTTATVLNSFSSRMGSTGFNGDLAHYITTKGIGGGRAYLNVLGSGSSARTGVSGNLNGANNAFPTYTWNANVICHEIGHNIGSNHTHWCGWPGGAIDDCYAVEGSCSAGPAPTSGGTIMSYCHLSIGINFNNGFGTLPGNLLRSRITDNAICNCNNLFIKINKTDEGCGGANNGVAEVVIEDGTGPFTYEWSNGANTPLVNGLAPGEYYVKVTGANASCTVVKGIRINSAATTLFVSKTPDKDVVTECNGNSVTLVASPLGGNGIYTYQWYNGVTPIAGETNPTYTANTSGNYYAVVTSGTCTGNASPININFAPVPSPTITSDVPSPICANQKIKLSVNPSTGYAVSWYLNGTLIADSISKDITVNTSGNYTARLTTLGNCQSNTLNFNVAVNPLPSASISPAASGIFCSGQTVLLTANTNIGTNYQWFLNGVAIAGETNNTYTVTAQGGYRVLITNAATTCSNQSTSVFYENRPKVNFTTQNIRPLIFCAGDSAIVKAIPEKRDVQGGIGNPGSNGEIFNYQWYKEGTAIAGATLDSIIIKVAGNYSIKVGSNQKCDSTKHNIIVVVNPIPTTSLLSSLGSPINYGDLTSLSTLAPFVSYQWYKNGMAIAGATNATYDIGDGGIYTCEITDGNGCRGISAPLVLQVLNNNPIISGVLTTNSNTITTNYNANNITLLRSTDGTSFNAIATLQSPFSYNDNVINNLSTYYYKLKVPKNGYFIYSNIVVLERGKQQQLIKLFPNPAQEYISISSTIPIQQYQVLDNVGRTISSTRTHQINVTALQVPLYNLPKGSYILRCHTQLGISNYVFIKN
jgi:hypothetical protein